MNQNRIEFIPKYSVLLCMMVVMIHNSIPNYFAYGTKNTAFYIHYCLTNVLPLLYACAVPSFFIISGFLFFRNYQKSDYRKKIKSRVHTLLIPYLLWNVFGLLTEMLTKIPFFSAMATVNSNPFDWTNIVMGIFFHRYTVLWFVFMIMLFAVLAPIIFYIIKKKILFSFVSVLLLLLVLFYDKGFCSFLGIGLEYSSIIYYFIGAYLGCYHKDIFNYRTNFNVYALILFFAATIALEIRVKDFEFYSRIYFILVKITLLYLIFTHFENKIKIKHWFSATFFIYAFHLPVMRFTTGMLRFLFNKIESNFALKELLLYVVSFVIVMMVCIKVSSYLEIKTPRIYKLLTGNR